MTRREWTRTIDLMVRTWGPKVNEAALGFEARWSRSALRNHSAKHADALQAALDQFDAAMSAGSSTDIENAGSRLCRGYALVAAELQNANVPEDAYMIGRDPDTKTEIIITASPAAAERAINARPNAQVFTPDEIARLLALDKRAQKVAAVKAAFPGAEITRLDVAGVTILMDEGDDR